MVRRVQTRLRVQIPRVLRAHFVRKAKLAFDREEYAVLLGRRSPQGSSFEILELFYPEDRHKHADSERVLILAEWHFAAQKYAREQGLEVLGDWHTHCWQTVHLVRDGSPSASDWESNQIVASWLGTRSLIFGVTTVLKHPESKRFRTRTRFWPMTPEVVTRVE